MAMADLFKSAIKRSIMIVSVYYPSRFMYYSKKMLLRDA